MNSEYYRSEARRYEELGKYIIGIKSSLEDCGDELSAGAAYMKELIVNKEYIDKEKLSNMSEFLLGHANSLNAVIAECNQKVAYYNQLADEAAAEEAKLLESSGSTDNSDIDSQI